MATQEQRDLKQLRGEKKAFAEMREKLLQNHEGEYALVANGALVGVFASSDDAYAEGLSSFGTDAVFLVARIEKDDPDVRPTPISWAAGVMFAS